MNLDELEELFSGDTAIGALVDLRLGENEIWLYREFSDMEINYSAIYFPSCPIGHGFLGHE